MEDVVIRVTEKVTLKNPVLVEGLPGVGTVGKLAADFLRERLPATPFATVHSKLLPPQVYVSEEGIIRLVSNELSYWRAKKPEQRDLILLGGDSQGISPEGQYELTEQVLKFVSGYGVKELYTLAGFAQGHLVEKPRVLGAATSATLVESMKKHGVSFSRNDPGGGLIGASGLFLGLGQHYGMEGVCLMGETSGYFVDPRGAEAVLRVLSSALHLDLDLSDLAAKAKEIDRIAQKVHDTMERPTGSSDRTREDLGYIG